MSTNIPMRKTITLPPEMWAQISELRYNLRIATEAEAVRRIIAAGIEGLENKSILDRAIVPTVPTDVQNTTDAARADNLADAIDYAIEQGHDGIGWLEAWRDGDPDAMADLAIWQEQQIIGPCVEDE